ncbi:MAG: hypothetical protein NVS9B10_22240 [Nevskia sp.]
MGKLLKIVFGILAALLLAAVLAVGAFALLFDPNDFRGRITVEVRKATGRDLVIGDIKLSLFPTLGARIGKATLSNASGFGDQPFAAVAEADVGVQLLPLILRREVKVSTVALTGLQLDAVKNADGRSNWDDLQKIVETPSAPQPPASGAPAIKSIDISGISIKDASISYTDNQAKTSYKLSRLNLRTGTIRPGSPFDFALDCAISSARPAANANVSLGAKLAFDRAKQRLDGSKIVLKLKAALPDRKFDLELGGNAGADLAKQLFSTDKLTLKLKAELPDMKADVDLSSRLSADLAAKVYKAEKLVASVVAEGRSLPGGKQKADLTGDAIYDGAKGSLKVASLDVLAAGLSATIALDASGLNGETPRFTGPLSVKPFNPRELLALFGTKIETADPAVLKDMSLKAKLDATTSSARFNELVIKLDQSTVSGSAAVTDLATKAAEFTLKLDAIDADRYLAPKSAAQAPAAAPATPAEKAKADAEPLPVDALDALNASGTVDIGKLKLSGVSMANVRLSLDAAKGREKRIGLAANLYGGSMTANTRIAPGARPGYVESLRLNSIAAGPLLKDFTGKESMTGEGNVALDLSSAGKTLGEVKRALNGDVAFNFVNGAVKGFNLGQILRQGQAFMAGQQFNESEPQQTDFTEFAAKGHITNGVLQSDALDAKSPLFRLDGAGKIDLVNQTLDYTAKPTVVNTATGQGGKNLGDLAGIVIPIRVTGSWAAPKYSLDLKTALQQKATEKLRGRLGEQIDKKLGDKLGDSPLKDQIQQGLDSLFGRKRKPEAPPAAAPAPAAAPTPAPPSP